MKEMGTVMEKVPMLAEGYERLTADLKVLRAAGLVSDRPEGTRRVYHIDPNGLTALRAWLDQFWDQALAGFEAEVERTIKRGREGK